MKKNTYWQIKPGVADITPGFIEHSKPPRLSAKWDTGDDVLENIMGPCWTFEASGADDVIHIYGFAWIDKPPDQEHFEKLMDEAATAIDEWIAERF